MKHSLTEGRVNVKYETTTIDGSDGKVPLIIAGLFCDKWRL